METWMTDELLAKVRERALDTLDLLRHAIVQRDESEMLGCAHVLRELREFVRPFGTDKDGCER